MNITDRVKMSNAYKDHIKKMKNSAWNGSMFELHKNLSPKAKGAWGERLTCDILESYGATVPRDKKGKNKKPKGAGSDYDVWVNDKKIEVKTSFAWDEEPDKFVWQQIRDQDYEYIVFIGVNPGECKAWWATKEDIVNNIFGRNEYRQHGGNSGEQDLYWIQTTMFDGNVPGWFRPIKDWGK